MPAGYNPPHVVYAGPPAAKRKKPKPPPRPRPFNPIAGLPGPASGGLDPYLGYGTGFNMYGHHFTANDQNAFERALRQHGVNPARWYANHPGAQRVFDPVSQAIYGNVTPQITGIKQQQKDAQDYYTRMMSSLTNFASALMPYLQQVPAVIGGAYDQGAAADSLLGKAYGGQFDINQNQNVGAIDAALQQLHLQGGPQQSNDASVVSTLGGGLEADILKAAGPAYANAAAQWPKQASLEAQDVMNQLLSQAASSNKDFESQIAAVLQGVPAMQQQFGQQQRAYDLQVRQQQLREITAAEEHAYKMWYISMKNKDFKASQHWKQVGTDLEQQRINIERGNAEGLTPSGQPKVGTHIDPTTGRPIRDGWHYDPKKGRPVKDVAPGTAGPGGKPLREGETPAYLRSKANDDLNKWIKAMKPGQKWTYRQAHRLLYQKYVGYVGRSFKNEAEFERMINQILSSRGITPGRTFQAGL